MLGPGCELDSPSLEPSAYSTEASSCPWPGRRWGRGLLQLTAVDRTDKKEEVTRGVGECQVSTWARSWEGAQLRMLEGQGGARVVVESTV